MAQLWSVKDHKLTISQIKEKMYFRVHTVGFYSKYGHFCPAFRDIIDESFLRFFNLPNFGFAGLNSSNSSLVWENERKS